MELTRPQLYFQVLVHCALIRKLVKSQEADCTTNRFFDLNEFGINESSMVAVLYWVFCSSRPYHSCPKETSSVLCDSLRAGWDGDASTAGNTAKQCLGKMSFVGKQQCKSLMQHLQKNLDRLPMGLWVGDRAQGGNVFFVLAHGFPEKSLVDK